MMSHGGKLSMLETMGQPRFEARLGDAVAAFPAASPELIASTLRNVEATRDAMAGEVEADRAALAEAVNARRNATVLGPLAWARGGAHLAASLDEEVAARETELRVTTDAHASLTRSSQRLRESLERRAKSGAAE